MKHKGATGIVIQGRMNSMRLDGKVLKPILGKPMLGYQLERIARVNNAERVIVATTTNPEDQAIVDFCDTVGVKTFRGSPEDVLSRYYGAAVENKLNHIVRITADCPVIDPAIVDRVIELFLNGEADYVSNAVTRSFPRGMDTEVMTFQALEICHKDARERYEREHVTPFIYCHPERFRIEEVIHPENLSRFRWTVDTPEDFELIQKMIQALYPVKPEFDMQDCLDLIRQNPEWETLNAHVTQKKYWE